MRARYRLADAGELAVEAVLEVAFRADPDSHLFNVILEYAGCKPQCVED